MDVVPDLDHHFMKELRGSLIGVVGSVTLSLKVPVAFWVPPSLSQSQRLLRASGSWVHPNLMSQL